MELQKQLSAQYELQSERVDQAGQRAGELLDILGEAASSAVLVRDSILHTSGFFDWWPYLVCPTASLIMGSYGLKPSGVRNIMLLVLGIISFPDHLPYRIFTYASSSLGEIAGYTITAIGGGRLLPWYTGIPALFESPIHFQNSSNVKNLELV